MSTFSDFEVIFAKRDLQIKNKYVKIYVKIYIDIYFFRMKPKSCYKIKCQSIIRVIGSVAGSLTDQVQNYGFSFDWDVFSFLACMQWLILVERRRGGISSMLR